MEELVKPLMFLRVDQKRTKTRCPHVRRIVIYKFCSNSSYIETRGRSTDLTDLTEFWDSLSLRSSKLEH